MLFKYCPECLSLSVRPHSGVSYKCSKCGYLGKPSEDSMDEINSLQKGAKSNSKRHDSDLYSNDCSVPTANELKEKLRKMKGTKSDDFEIF